MPACSTTRQGPQAIFTIGYGQSEAGSNITFPCPAYPIANGNVGIPMPLNTMGIFRGEKECGYNEKGEEILLFGKYKGRTVEEVFRIEPGYYAWMMNGDFPLYTKKVITELYLRSKQGK